MRRSAAGRSMWLQSWSRLSGTNRSKNRFLFVGACPSGAAGLDGAWRHECTSSSGHLAERHGQAMRGRLEAPPLSQSETSGITIRGVCAFAFSPRARLHAHSCPSNLHLERFVRLQASSAVSRCFCFRSVTLARRSGIRRFPIVRFDMTSTCPVAVGECRLLFFQLCVQLCHLVGGEPMVSLHWSRYLATPFIFFLLSLWFPGISAQSWARVVVLVFHNSGCLF